MQYIYGRSYRSDSFQSNGSDGSSNWKPIFSGLRVYKPRRKEPSKPHHEKFTLKREQERDDNIKRDQEHDSILKCEQERDSILKREQERNSNLSFASTTSTLSSASSSISDTDTVSEVADVKTENLASTAIDAATDSMPRFTVYIWYGHNAGLTVETCPHTKFPMVKRVEGNRKLPGMWNVRYGDYLLSFNGESTHASEMDLDDVRQLLETSGVRPAILRFRHASPEEIRKRPYGAQATQLSSRQLEFQHQRMAHEQRMSFIVINEGCYKVGVDLHLASHRAKYPSVVSIDPNGPIKEQSEENPVEVGDLLLSVNGNDVTSIGTTMAMNVIRSAPRPLVLVFFRKNSIRRQRSPSIEL